MSSTDFAMASTRSGVSSKAIDEGIVLAAATRLVHIGRIGLEDQRQGVADGGRTGAKGVGLGIPLISISARCAARALRPMARRSARSRVLSA